MEPRRKVGRPKGSGHKLTQRQVEEIRAAYQNRDAVKAITSVATSYRSLARQYGVSYQMVANIVKGECWAPKPEANANEPTDEQAAKEQAEACV